MPLDRSGSLYLVLRRMRSRAHAIRYRLHNVPTTTLVSRGCRISTDLVIGDYGYIGYGCDIGPRVRLGDYVMVGPRAAFVGADHRMDVPGVPMVFAGRPDQTVTDVHSDVWVGFGAVIMAGITLGRGAVVAANATVTKDVAPYTVVGGTPAKVIGARFNDPVERARHDRLLTGRLSEGRFAGSKQTGR